MRTSLGLASAYGIVRDLQSKILVDSARPWRLFVSGYTDTVLGDQGIFDGELQLLPKPFSPGDLAQAVRDALTGTRRAVLSPALV